MLAPVEANQVGPEAHVERRSGARQRLLLRIAKLRCSSGEYPCIMQDVSETGAKLKLFGGHPPDSHMFLELSNGELYAVERRWIDGELAGVRFSSAVDVQEFINEPCRMGRRPVRLRLEHQLQIVASGDRGHAVLLDLSAQGACIEAGRQVPVGSALKIEIPGHEPRFAHVCWRTNFRHGLAFQQAFSFREFAQLAVDLQPFVAVQSERNAIDEAAQSVCA